MKWLNDPPADWDSAPEEPPADADTPDDVTVERLVNGVVIRDPGSDGAYVYASDGAAVDDPA